MAGQMPMDSLLDQLRSQSRAQQTPSQPQSSAQFTQQQQQHQRQQSPHHLNYHLLLQQQQQQRDLASPTFPNFQQQHGGMSSYPQNYGYPSSQYVQQLGGQNAFYSSPSPHPQQSMPPAYMQSLNQNQRGDGDVRSTNLLHLLKNSSVPTVRDGPSESTGSPSGERDVRAQRAETINPLQTSILPSTSPALISPSMNPHDLVATLLGKVTSPHATEREERQSGLPAASPGDMPNVRLQKPSEAGLDGQQRNFLHEILGRSKPVQDEGEASTTPVRNSGTEHEALASHQHSENTSGQMPEIPQALRDLAQSTMLPPDSSDRAESNDNEGSSNHASNLQAKPMFTYVNPFDQLHATSPRNRTPKPVQQRPSAAVSKTMETNSGTASPVPPMVPLPFSPQPQDTGDGAAESSFIPETQKYGQDLHQLVDTSRHTPPIQEPYVEAVQEPGDTEIDPFGEEEIDPFEDVDDADELEEKNDDLEVPASNGTENNVEKEAETTEQTLSQGRNIDIIQSSKSTEGLDSDYRPEHFTDKETTDLPALKVYNFPMKPFSLIIINPIQDSPFFSEGKFSDIARMTRTLDQLDRNLISASGRHIVYAMNKAKGGVRVIRQEDGQDMVLMKDNSDKVVHVTISKEDRVIATGSSGAVLWGKIQNNDFEDAKSNSCFVFPPSDQQDQNGGLTKSRAHKSSRHEDIFAIGRGRFIHLISADAASKFMSEEKNTNEVNEKSYFAKFNRVIDTGKVSKDFCFSEDDTAILSVDKAGKIKLWDIESLTQFNAESDQDDESLPVLTEPLTYFSAISTGESYKATSIMFLDKLRPYQKGLALRYVLVGLRQNHTLQLWDLAIGKPVQEVRFPQESQTDALCSVAYHPSTGIIVVGNPTRNSIYFVHLSAPRYNLPNISQTEYAKAINTKSPILPKVDATAIMSGLREYSFGSKGQLISLDILDVMPVTEDTPFDGEESTLFELYIAHSKGMTCLTVMKEDLGWDKDCKAKVSADAVKEGVCKVSPLPATVVETASKAADAPDASISARETRPDVEPQTKSILKPVAPPAPTPVGLNKKKVIAPPTVPPVAENVVDKVDDKSSSDAGRDRKMAPLNKGKKTKKEQNIPIPPLPSVFTPASELNNPLSPKKKDKAKEKEKLKDEPKTTFGITPEFLDREIRKIETAVSAEFTTVLGKELTTLYQKIDDERRVQQASGDAKQEAVLRMMSTSLVSGMEKVLAKLITSEIEQKVMPEIDSSIAKSLQNVVPTAMAAQVSSIVPDAVKKSLLNKDFVQQITNSVNDLVKREMDKTIKATLAPALDKMSAETTKLVSTEVSKKTRDALKEAKKVHESDTAKIQQLTEAITEMTKAFTIMENNVASLIQQAKFRPEAQDTPTSGTPPQQQAPPLPPPRQLTEEEMMMADIEEMLLARNFEGGILVWLQSKEKQDIVFNNVMCRHDPRTIIPNLSIVVVLTVAASVTGSFDTKISERLDWLETALTDLSQIPDDDSSRYMIPRIMGVIISRLQQYYMAFAEDDPSHPLLKRIAACSRASNALMKAVVA